MPAGKCRGGAQRRGELQHKKTINLAILLFVVTPPPGFAGSPLKEGAGAARRRRVKCGDRMSTHLDSGIVDSGDEGRVM